MVQKRKGGSQSVLRKMCDTYTLEQLMDHVCATFLPKNGKHTVQGPQGARKCGKIW